MPGVSIFVVTTLSVAVAANATMAGLVDRLLFRAPPHIARAEQVVRILLLTRDRNGRTLLGASASYPMLQGLRKNVRAFDDAAAFSHFQMSVGAGADAVEANVTLVSPNFFQLLGVPISPGRGFQRSDGFPNGIALGGPTLAVLGHGFWVRRFGSDPRVVGRTIRVGTNSYTIIGVAPSRFRGFEESEPDLWIPAPVAAPIEAPALWYGGASWLSVVARLRPGASPVQAAREATMYLRSSGMQPETAETRVVAAPSILARGPDAPREARISFWLAAVAVLVLVIACANVASVLLAQALTRRREVSLRIALGATRGRIATQLLIESLVYAFLATAGGVILAALGGRLLAHWTVVDFDATPLLAFVDRRLLAYTIMLGVATAVMCASAPLWHVWRGDLASAMHLETVNAPRSTRHRAGLLAVQTALSTALLLCAGYVGLSFWRITRLDLGVDLDHTLMVRFDRGSTAQPRQEQDAMYRELRQRVERIPGVERVAFTEFNPYRNGRAVAVHTLEHDSDFYSSNGVDQAPMEAAVDTGFFRTVGARIHGRDFDSRDRAGSQPVAIINEPLARLLWPAQDAVGQCIVLPPRADDPTENCHRVVGVVEGFWRRSVLQRDLKLVYVPFDHSPVPVGPPQSLFVRFRGEPQPVVSGIRATLQALRPDLPAVGIQRVRDMVEPQLRPWRTAALMFVLFGLIGVAMAVSGLYSLLAFTVAQRKREIAICTALGAQSRHLLARVLGEAASSMTVGLVIGIALALAMRSVYAPLLFQTGPSDWRALFGTVVVVLLGAIAGMARPAVRAMRIGVNALLRE